MSALRACRVAQMMAGGYPEGQWPSTWVRDCIFLLLLFNSLGAVCSVDMLNFQSRPEPLAYYNPKENEPQP